MHLRTHIFLNRIREKISLLFARAWKKIQTREFMIGSAVLLFVVVGSFVAFHGAQANIMDSLKTGILKIFSYILYAVAYALGWIAMKMFSVLILIASYNEFVTSPAVAKGWVLIRDICNMAITMILLIIAFGTILHVKTFGDSKLLPKLLVAAILINFSKVIVGLAIDAAQVFMMTFVNGFAATGGANLINGLGLTNVLSWRKYSNGAEDSIDWWDICVMLLVAVIFLILTVIVVFRILVTLVIRVVMLWMLAILSPIGILGFSEFAPVKKYSKMWWDKFSEWVVIGPIVAFFLWLSLLIMADPANIDVGGQFKLAQQNVEAATPGKTEAALGSLANLPVYILALGMLFMANDLAKGIAGKVPAIGKTVEKYGDLRAAGKATWGATKKVGAGTWAVTKRLPGINPMVNTAAGYAEAMKKNWGAGKKKREAAQRARGAGMYASQARAVGQIKQKVGGTVYAGVSALSGAAVLAGIKSKMKGGTFGEGFKHSTAAGYREYGVSDLGVKAAHQKEMIDAQGKEFGAQDLDAGREADYLRNGNNFEKAAMLKQMAEKGVLSERLNAMTGVAKGGKPTEEQRKAQQKIVQDALKGVDPGASKGITDKMKENFAHFAYDLNTDDGRDKLTADLKKGKVSMESQSLETLQNPEFAKAALAGKGAATFEAKMGQIAKDKGDAYKDAIAQSLVTAMEDDDVKTNPAKLLSMQMAFANVTGDITHMDESTQKKYLKGMNAQQAAAFKPPVIQAGDTEEEAEQKTQQLQLIASHISAVGARAMDERDPDGADAMFLKLEKAADAGDEDAVRQMKKFASDAQLAANNTTVSQWKETMEAQKEEKKMAALGAAMRSASGSGAAAPAPAPAPTAADFGMPGGSRVPGGGSMSGSSAESRSTSTREPSGASSSPADSVLTQFRERSKAFDKQRKDLVGQRKQMRGYQDSEKERLAKAATAAEKRMIQRAIDDYEEKVAKIQAEIEKAYDASNALDEEAVAAGVIKKGETL